MRADDGRVVPNFITQALRGEPLTVFDDGSRRRVSFCYVADLVDGIYRLLHLRRGEPVNLGNPHEMTILTSPKHQGADRHASPRSSSCTPKNERTQDDPLIRQPDIAKARRVLGWEPKVSLEEGLGLTVEYFRKLLGKEKA